MRESIAATARGPAPQHLDPLIDLAIAEDIGPGDITTNALPKDGRGGVAEIVAKEALVIAGLDAVRRVFERVDAGIRFVPKCSDGDAVSAGSVVATAAGSFASLLISERIALNFLQRLSGIATHVRAYVQILSGRSVRLVDTRKTIPGWRVLEKYAVRMGGAANHRMGLYDGILIKDNHIEAFGGIGAAVSATREQASHLLKVEVETSSLEEVEEALAAGADVIMLDNMTEAEISEAVQSIGGRALVEVSGQVDRDALVRLADLGVDIISAGALIHRARFVDLSMRIMRNSP